MKIDQLFESGDDLASQFAQMAKEKGMNVRVRGTPDQERQRTQDMLAQRRADQEKQSQLAGEKDFANLDQLEAEYAKMKDEYQSLGGSNWQYADREQNLSASERKARSMEDGLRALWSRIQRAKKYSGGVAEAHDPKFTGFMNKALGTRQDAKPQSYDPNTTMTFDNMPGYKHAFKFGMNIIKKMDPDTKEHFANASDNTLLSYMIDIAEKKGFIPKYFVEEDLDEVTQWFDEQFHDPEMEGWSWADLLRDMIGQEPNAANRAAAQSHKQMMAKSQAAKDKPESIDPTKLKVVDRTDTGKSEIWYPHGDFFGTSSWAVVQDGFKDKAHAEHALKQLKTNPNIVNIIKKAIADEGLAEGDDRTVANIKNYERELAKYKKFNANGAHDVKIKNLEKIIAHLKSKQGVAEGDALADFLAKGGKIHQLPYKKPRKADKTDYGSKHIGGSGDKMKSSRTGKAAKTQGTKVVGVGESAPKGWEGTVKAMKKHKEIDNPYALTNWMKNKGYKSHKKESMENHPDEKEDKALIRQMVKKQALKRENMMAKEQHEDHEISMATSELKNVYINAKKLFDIIKKRSEQEGLDAWQQSKITKASDYLNSVLTAIRGEPRR